MSLKKKSVATAITFQPHKICFVSDSDTNGTKLPEVMDIPTDNTSYSYIIFDCMNLQERNKRMLNLKIGIRKRKKTKQLKEKKFAFLLSLSINYL